MVSPYELGEVLTLIFTLSDFSQLQWVPLSLSSLILLLFPVKVKMARRDNGVCEYTKFHVNINFLVLFFLLITNK